MIGWVVACSVVQAPDEASSVFQSQPSGAVQAPGRYARLDVAIIRYSQAGYSFEGTGDDGTVNTIAGNVQWLKDHPDQDLPWYAPIRVFVKQPFMDEWGRLSNHGFTGDPKNLENGQIYTLDHRRLVAYQHAGRKTIPVEWADLSVVREDRWKFTTLNKGISIAPNP